MTFKKDILESCKPLREVSMLALPQQLLQQYELPLLPQTAAPCFRKAPFESLAALIGASKYMEAIILSGYNELVVGETISDGHQTPLRRHPSLRVPAQRTLQRARSWRDIAAILQTECRPVLAMPKLGSLTQFYRFPKDTRT